MWGRYDDIILHRLCNINRILFQSKAVKSYTIKCIAFCDERILYYQNDLGVNMWKIRVHTRDCPRGFYLTPTFKTEEEAVAYAVRTDMAWRYNAYCTYEQIGE